MSGADRSSLSSKLLIRQATAADLPAILALFDGAVSWLVSRALAGQWGTVPFSERPKVAEQFSHWVEQGTLFVASLDEEITGTIVISAQPPTYAAEHCARHPRQALYLEAFVTDRRYKGCGIGSRLLHYASERARQQQIPWLRLDCWAGNSDLCRYYREAGFEPFDHFQLGDWQGILFEKAVPL